MTRFRRRRIHTGAVWIGGAGIALAVWTWCLAQLDADRQLTVLAVAAIVTCAAALLILARHDR